MIFVIAGNYEQFRQFRKQLHNVMVSENIPFRSVHHIVYVDLNNIRGYDNIWGYKVGTWKQRQDIDQIKELLLVCRSSIDEFIEVEL